VAIIDTHRRSKQLAAAAEQLSELRGAARAPEERGALAALEALRKVRRGM
jgi:hypothetical protein